MDGTNQPNNEPKGSKKRWSFVDAFKSLDKRLANSRFSITRTFKGLDRWLAGKQITADTFSTEKERKFLAWISLRAVAVIMTVIVLVAAGTIIASIIFSGLSRPQSTQLPPVQATQSAHPVVDVWSEYDKLSQSEARNLRTQNNVLNLAILDGGGATYLKGYGIRFNPDNPTPWQEMAQPPGFTNLSVIGTSIKVGADNQTYSLNLYQGFVRLRDPTNLYLVDKNGRIWSTKYSKDVVIPLPVQAPIQIAPNPELNLTY